jgi:RNA polymerase sigma-70 factor, ECF subfamily
MLNRRINILVCANRRLDANIGLARLLVVVFVFVWRDTVMKPVETPNVDAEIDDATLILRIAQQNRAAFHSLYDRYAGHALGLAARVLNDTALGEDVVQEAFMRIWHNANKFDVTRGSAKTWILTVVHRLAIDSHRRRQARPTLLIDAPEYEDWDLPDEGASVPEAVESRLSQQQVQQAMCALPEAHRSILELAYFKGMTHREIADHLSEPLGTVHSRVRQGMILLKKMLWNKVEA